MSKKTFLKIHLLRMNPPAHKDVLQMWRSHRSTRNFAIPTPRFANKFSTWNPSSHAEGAYPQNCMVEQPKNQLFERKQIFKRKCSQIYQSLKENCTNPSRDYWHPPVSMSELQIRIGMRIRRCVATNTEEDIHGKKRKKTGGKDRMPS